MFGRIALGILLVLVLIAGVVGVGGYAYQMGVAQGLASSGKLDVAPTQGVVPFPYFGMPFMYRPFGFGFGFLGCLAPLFFFFLFFGVMRMIFGRRHWGMHHPRHWDGQVPPMMAELHRKMHEQQSQQQPPAQQA